MTVRLRRAVAADEARIKSLVRQVGINPIGLNWRRFVVAEDDGLFVGCGQIKPHRDGTRELASLAVLPQRQGTGIGSRLVTALIDSAPGELYLMCRSTLAPYYRRFGFEEIGVELMPRRLRAVYRGARMFSKVFRARGFGLSIMRRAG